MANPEHLAMLGKGVKTWNRWRERNPGLKPDLREASLTRRKLKKVNFDHVNLARANLVGADLEAARLVGVNLCKANLSQAYLLEENLVAAKLRGGTLYEANLCSADLRDVDARESDLRKADLGFANLFEADLSAARLEEASLARTNLYATNLSRANVQKADLMGASLFETNLENANITGCSIYGVSVWGVRLEGAIQSNLVITPWGESPIQVDNLEVAQFIYLLLNNEKIRHVIDAITSKVVLILGRFTPGRKTVLDKIREELRKRDYLPVLFDFEKPRSRDLTETISTLAHMARFVIADITDAKSIPQELQRIVPDLPSVPVQPLLLASQAEYGMFEHFRRYPWVLEPVLYKDQATLLAELERKVITPAEAKAKEQT